MNRRLALFVVVLFCASLVPVYGQQVEGTSDVISLDIQPENPQQTVQHSDYQEAVVTGGVFFQDPSGENQLDAGETAELRITLSNQGTEAARGIAVTLQSSSSVEGMRVGDEEQVITTEPQQIERVDHLGPAEAREITIPLHASESLPEESIQLVVDLEVDRGQVVGSPDNVSIPTGDVTTAPLVDRQIPETNMDRGDAVAVVIGVSQYMTEEVPPVDYAVRDAEVVERYLTETLGFDPANVITLENPTKSSMDAVLGTADDHRGRLYDLTSDTSEVFVFYSGHGAPNSSEENGRTYFLPSDARPNQLSLTGYPVDLLYENLSKVTSGAVTVAIDACFSGQTERGTLVQDASPALLSVENPVVGMEKGLVLTASKADQISSWYPEMKHGLFTYYFLKGLQGEADMDDDQVVDGKEMGEYLSDQVPRQARRLYSRDQNPQVFGRDENRVLVRFDR